MQILVQKDQAPMQLLTDAQMSQFITQGYLVLQNQIPDELHQKVMQQIHYVLTEEGNPGNNILPRVPDIRTFFETSVVEGALTSVLGPGYYLHPHRHCHYNQPANQNPGGGEWHKDGYWSAMRSHRPWWAMIFYYTQPIVENMGPTAIMPGSQYKEKFPGPDEPFLLPAGPAGTMVLVHFDLWHRASLNHSAIDRYMLKFQFARVRPPVSPSWDNRSNDFMPPQGYEDDGRKDLWSDVWDWLRGESSDHARAESSGEPEVQALLNGDSEDAALHAAYKLGRDGRVQALLSVLKDGSSLSAQRAAYGIQAAGEKAVPGLVGILEHSDERRRALAAFALGMIGVCAGQVEQHLIRMLNDPSEWVRRNAIEALGMLSEPSMAAVSALVRELERAVSQETPDSERESEKGYLLNQGYIKNKIGYTAALSLLRIGKFGNAAEVANVLEFALGSSDRYVRAYAFEAVTHLESPEAIRLLTRYYRSSRWCPDTSKASMF